mmetsp:Transcript_39190/g.71784  ORF Transcript_39190/g.71784 Transcript_39190/m.71784 type:complete len:475 (-) Transcript_39190:117-1541(-)|eukprot:CAMPEP_0202021308 /NCGR_PEP_ID=MMETSP0905-20130828/46627_1 /ASSEMBLY_ACC=CAM_ASM_000554 /TAXON_ID=420261 /ORGANISM="Thalassiosira antarctica, Strain CCMP982" /LENGTH=474 /DNA_ID=CAMNT_0048583147 /DNA_START=27 /DNA_END=1451 /DNA_ORIENTATION=-
MAKKFSFNLLRKGGSKKSRHDAALALPPPTTRPKQHRSTPPANNATAADQHSKKNNGLFNKNIGPGGLELITTATTSTSGPQDEVSVITPVTGIPPDSPDRLRNLPSLLPPPPPSRPLGNNTLYSAKDSPPSTPSRSDMRIHIPQGGSDNAEDDISVMTPISHMNKATNKQKQQLRFAFAPPQILDDDEDSRDLTVYEADEGNDSRGGGSSVLRKNSKFRLSPLRMEAVKSSSNKVSIATSKLLKSKKSWLTQTEYFQKAIDSSFDMIDVDKSGDVSLEELYAGLLLIHLKLAVYAGAPACRPASKEYVTEIFHLLDTDDSGTLGKEEFAEVIKILYSQVFTRIVIHWCLTLMIVPVISQYIIKFTILLYWIAHEFWKDIDDDLDPIQRLLWKIWAKFLYMTPAWIDRIGALVWMAFCKVPKGVWKSMPFTFLTVAQTSVALPYALNRVEDFFRRVAHSDVGKHEERRGKLKDI